MKYRRDYQETHDIDFFFKYKNRFFHAASNGGILPDGIDSRINRRFQEIIENIDDNIDVITNEYRAVIASNITDYYDLEDDLNFNSFLRYAAMGFISIDRTCDEYCYNEYGEIVENQHEYHVVARPENRWNMMVPSEILRSLPDLSDLDLEISGFEG